MPNTPAQIGRGRYHVDDGLGCHDEQKETAGQFSAPWGKEFYARDEGWLDNGHRRSGSGPAYLSTISKP